MSVEVVHKPPRPVPEEVAKIWAEEGKQVHGRERRLIRLVSSSP